MPSFRVTYHVVVQAASPDEAIAEAAKAAKSGGVQRAGGSGRCDGGAPPGPGSTLRLHRGRCQARAP